MKNLFDRNFFKALLGFLGLLIASMGIVVAAGYYESSKTAGNVTATEAGTGVPE